MQSGMMTNRGLNNRVWVGLPLEPRIVVPQRVPLGGEEGEAALDEVTLEAGREIVRDGHADVLGFVLEDHGGG